MFDAGIGVPVGRTISCYDPTPAGAPCGHCDACILRRKGFAPAQMKQLIDTLRDYFRRRLSETLDDAGELRLMTDGKALFLQTRQGHVFDVLIDPFQPLIADGLPLRRVHARKGRRETGHKVKAKG